MSILTSLGSRISGDFYFFLYIFLTVEYFLIVHVYNHEKMNFHFEKNETFWGYKKVIKNNDKSTIDCPKTKKKA